MIPSKPTVPEHWKAANGGPYRQAPPEYGGQWWYVNPFTGEEPWLRANAPSQPEEELPPGFVDIFGPRPQFADFPNSQAWKVAKAQWETDLKTFVREGMPVWLSREKASALDLIFLSWGMGHPRWYGNIYGEQVRWPQSEVPDFQIAASTVVNYPHQVVAMYQTELVANGGEVEQRHPFTPPVVFGEDPDVE